MYAATGEGGDLKLPDCLVPLVSQAICKLYYISLRCAHTHVGACEAQEPCLKMFFLWHELYLCILSCNKVLIENGLQRQTE